MPSEQKLISDSYSTPQNPRIKLKKETHFLKLS